MLLVIEALDALLELTVGPGGRNVADARDGASDEMTEVPSPSLERKSGEPMSGNCIAGARALSRFLLAMIEGLKVWRSMKSALFVRWSCISI
jgi:hypothetical protein